MARVLRHNVVCKATGSIHGAYATLRGAEYVAASGSYKVVQRGSTQPVLRSPSGEVGKRTVYKAR